MGVGRIELLETDEKKDGILGQEVFDGDEMLDLFHSSGHDGTRPDRGGAESETHTQLANTGLNGLKRRLNYQNSFMRDFKPSAFMPGTGRRGKRQKQSVEKDAVDDLGRPISPRDAASQIERSNAASADSTIYAVRYHPTEDSPPIDENDDCEVKHEAARDESFKQENGEKDVDRRKKWDTALGRSARKLSNFKARAFQKARSSPPVEIKKARALEESSQHTDSEKAQGTKILRRLGRGSKAGVSHAEPPPTVIPAPPRGQTWSPATMRHSPLSEHVATRAAEGFGERLQEGNELDHEVAIPPGSSEQAETALAHSSNLPAEQGGESGETAITSRPIARQVIVDDVQTNPAEDNGGRANDLTHATKPP